MHSSRRWFSAVLTLCAAGSYLVWSQPTSSKGDVKKVAAAHAPVPSAAEKRPSHPPRAVVPAVPAIDLAASPAPLVSGKYGDLPLAFEENHGQTDSRVKYLARGKGYTLFLTPKEAVLSLRYATPCTRQGTASAVPLDDSESTRLQPLRASRSGDAACSSVSEATNLGVVAASDRLLQKHTPPKSYSAVELEFAGASHARPRIEGIEKLEGITNYFIGNDPSQWHTEIPNYRKVVYRNAYPGIDVAYYGNPGQLETDFIIKPGANPRAIQLRAKGATATRLDQNGDLLLSTAAGEVRLHKPIVYQESAGAHREIAGNYRVREDGLLSFSVATYDRSLPLVIDPTLTFSTFLGGSTVDQATGVAADSAGEAYVTGFTSSTDFPTSATPLQGATGGAPDAFVTKYNAGGTAFVFSTYLGGSGLDQGNGIAVNKTTGDVFVTGFTLSSDFPTVNPLAGQGPPPAGAGNGFVAKIAANGSALLFSTYLGGNGGATGNGIAVDGAGDTYVTGQTASTNFPAVAAFQPALASTSLCCNAFVTKIKGDGSAITYSSYLGGEANDFGSAIAVDPTGNAYLTGGTTSAKFNTKAPIQPSLGGTGATNAFVAEVSFTASPAPAASLVYSTYLGGSASDQGTGIAVDASGNAYVAGRATSPDFPLKNPLQAPDNGGDAFVAKVAAGGGSLDFSTPFGGGGDIGTGIALDSTGNIYITGATSAQVFPTKVPLQAILSGSQAAFVAELKNDGSDSIFSTYLGGSSFDQLDQGNAIAVDTSANIYVAGLSGTLDFPTVTPFQVLPKSLEGNAFVAKIAPATPAGTQMYPPNLNFGSVPQGSTTTEVVTLAAGNNPVMVNSVTVGGANPGDFSEFDSCGPATVPPTVVCAFTIGFTPSANGPRSATFTINEASGQLSFTASGTGIAAATPPPNGTITFAPTNIVFANQEVSIPSQPQSIAITVTGNTPVTLQSAFGNGGTDPGDFFQGTASTNPCPFGSPIAAGITCNVGVVFDPQVAGPRSANFSVFGTFTTSPATVTVNGTGTAAPTLLPTFLQFPATVDGTTSGSMTVTLTNNLVGTALTGITPQISGPFTITGTTCPGPAGGLPGGQMCTFSIAFTPPANATPLNFLSGSFTVTDSDPAFLFVSLFGTPINPNATLISSTGAILFGRVPDGILTASSAFVENGGNTNLTVAPTLNTTAPAGTFQLVNSCTTSVAPASSCGLGINFTPPTPGPFFATLTIAGTNPAGGPATNSPQIVQISGTGVAATTANLAPNPLVFPAVPMGQTSAVEYAFLSNTGKSIDFMQSQTIAPGTFQNDFNPNNNGKAPFNTLCFPNDPLNPQGVCVIGVTFTPSTTGLETATLQVTDTSSTSPLSITLQGGQAAGPPIVQLSTNTLNFNAQALNQQSGEQTVTVTNTGASGLTITAIAATGDFQCFAQGVQTCALPNQQTLNPPCTTVAPLAPAASCDISVAFTPTALGTRNGMLSITDNAAGSPQTVTLTGTGVSGQLTVTPVMINFPVQIVNTTSASMPVTVSNGTTFNQNVLFPIVTPAGFAETDNCASNGAPVPIPPNGTCTINVTFTPTSATQFQGNLQLSIQQGNGSPSPTPFSVALTGMGSNATFTLTIAPGSSSTVTTTPGGTAAVGIIVAGTQGIPQTIMLSASTTSQFISTAVTPAKVTLSGIGNQQVAATLQTFCRGNAPLSLPRRMPPLGGIGLLLAALAFATLALAYRRQPRWAFALALVMLIAIGGAACGGDPGPSGATPPGTYPVTLTATSGQQVQTLNLTLIVQ
jgi:Beta-propeller repeat